MIDFVIAGAGKSGTSSLAKLLEKHPQVCFSSIKEPGFFTDVNKSEIYPRDGAFNKGFDWYESLFDSENCTRGEASTIYFTTSDTPHLLDIYVPNVKLLFLLRNPVDRFYSHYWQERKTRSIKKPLKVLFKENNERLKRYYANSSYKKNLNRFIDVLGRDSIKILIFEQFVNNSERKINEIFKFLQLQSLGECQLPQKNPSALPKWNWLQDVIFFLKNHSIRKYLPNFIKNTGGNILRYIKNKNLKNYEYPDLDPRIKNKLYNEFEPDIEFVEDLLNKKIDAWRQ